MSEERKCYDFFWLAIAIMVVAMMHYNYSCNCNEGSCTSPMEREAIGNEQ